MSHLNEMRFSLVGVSALGQHIAQLLTTLRVKELNILDNRGINEDKYFEYLVWPEDLVQANGKVHAVKNALIRLDKCIQHSGEGGYKNKTNIIAERGIVADVNCDVDVLIDASNDIDIAKNCLKIAKNNNIDFYSASSNWYEGNLCYNSLCQSSCTDKLQGPITSGVISGVLAAILTDRAEMNLLKHSFSYHLPITGISSATELECILKTKTATVLGMGVLGTVIAPELALQGLNLNIIDKDTIERKNVERQLLYGISDIGAKKTDVAKIRLEQLMMFAQEKTVNINSTYARILSVDDIIQHFNRFRPDTVILAVDNDYTRIRMSDTCVAKKMSCIDAAISASGGRLYNYYPQKTSCFKHKAGAEYILSQRSPEDGDPCVPEVKIPAKVVGSMAAGESIANLLGQPLQGKLHCANIPIIYIESIDEHCDCGGVNHYNIISLAQSRGLEVKAVKGQKYDTTTEEDLQDYEQ